MIVGIDPGASGAIAFTDDDAIVIYDLADMPEMDGRVSGVLLANIIRRYLGGTDTAVIEQVGAMPKQGVSSMFKFGCAWGVALGVLGALEIPITMVTPAKWKRDMGIGADKDLARRRACEWWPNHADSFKRKKDAGRAEAALLCRWLARSQFSDAGPLTVSDAAGDGRRPSPAATTPAAQPQGELP